jgi:DNA-binding transcriptional ArsR family regulator
LSPRERPKLSSSGYARESGAPLGTVSYHVKALKEAAVVELVDTGKRPGALEHFYSLTGPNAALVLKMLDLLEDA